MFSRQKPSPRYQELLALYKIAHEHGLRQQGVIPQKTFDGRSLLKELPKIKNLVQLTGSVSLLDYGCGKARFHHERNFTLPTGEVAASLQEYLGVSAIGLYDPGVPDYSRLPETEFDGVISTDVLEHCPEVDIPWILDEIFGFAKKFIFANVASFPASKFLDNGENAHCTQQPPEWWGRQITELSKRYPEKLFRIEITQNILMPAGLQSRTTAISNIR